MRVRVMTVDLKPESLAEAAEKWPQYAANFKERGLCSLYFAADPKTGKAVSVTVWENQAAIDAAEKRPDLGDAFKSFERYYAAPPRWDTYDLLATLD